MKKAKKQNPPDWLRFFDPGELLMCATRYYMPRQSIGSSMFPGYLLGAWDELPERLRGIIKQDLLEEARRDDWAFQTCRWHYRQYWEPLIAKAREM